MEGTRPALRLGGYALLAGLLAGVALIGAVQIGYQAYRYTTRAHPAFPPVAQGPIISPTEDFIDPAWILEGKPRFLTAVYFDSPQHRVLAGTWEAFGPARFKWHYGIDETVMVLEGGAQLTYEGKTHALVPGSTAYFAAGSTVIWNVPERVKKTFVLHEPGRVARRLRPWLPENE